MEPLITLIIPIYNAGPYLRQCLDSVTNQTIKSIEIICVNDGSTDDSPEIVREYMSRDNRIKLISKENHGYGAAMNDGLAIAQGEYIGIVEPDDYIDVSMYETLLGVIQSSCEKIDFVKGSWYECSDDGESITKVDPYKDFPEETPIDVREHERILLKHPSTVMGLYRKAFLDEHEIRYKEAPGAGWVDNPFMLQTMFFSGKIAVTRKPLYYYRTARPGSSSDLQDCSVPFCRLEEMFDFLEEEGSQGPFMRTLAKRTFFYLREVLSSRYYGEQKAIVEPLIESVVSRIPPDILESGMFTDLDRENYQRFSSPKRALDNRSPEVSVIVPCFNSASTIEKTIRSLIGQSLQHIEIICVDSGSNDDTRYLLRGLEREDPRIRIFTNVEEGRLSSSANVGINASLGRYITVLGQSDIADPMAYRELLELADKERLEICKSDYYVFADSAPNKNAAIEHCCIDEADYGKVITQDQSQVVLSAARKDVAPAIYKSEFIKHNDIWFSENEDNLFFGDSFFVKSMLSVNRIAFSSSRLFYISDHWQCQRKEDEDAFAVFVLYGQIEEWLKRNAQNWDNIKDLFASISFRRYMDVVPCVEKERIRQYLEYASRQLTELIRSERVSLRLFSNPDRQTALLLMGDVDAYYDYKFKSNDEVEKLRKDLAKARKKNKDYASSTSWKIGRAITLLPRKLKRIKKRTGGVNEERAVAYGNEPRVLFAAADAKYSGATLSLVALADGLRRRGENVIIVLNCHGPIEELLKAKRIPYEIVKSATWACSEDAYSSEVEAQKERIEQLNPSAIQRIRDIIKERRINIVHTNTLGVSVAAEAAREEGVKHIWHLREFVKEDHHLRFVDDDYANELIGSSDLLICISNAVYKKYAALYGAKKCRVIYNGIDPLSFFIPNRNLFCDQTIHLTVAGRLCEGKGQIDAVEAMAALCKRHNNLRLSLVGETVHTDYVLSLKRLIREYSLGTKIEITGPATHMDRIWAETDIALITSRMEAFGRCAVEAMMAGSVVVGANTGGTKEILQDGCGYLYAPGNVSELVAVLEEVLSNKNDSRNTALKAQDMAVKRFSAKRNEEEIASVHCELLEIGHCGGTD